MASRQHDAEICPPYFLMPNLGPKADIALAPNPWRHNTFATQVVKLKSESILRPKWNGKPLRYHYSIKLEPSFADAVIGKNTT
jgi:hypothetical protein